MTDQTKRKRPKVRFVAVPPGIFKAKDAKNPRKDVAIVLDDMAFDNQLRRIAAALNFHEAHKRGEL